jgi:hypothetical protein
MNKIHFATVIAPDLDYDLINHWCEHYQRLQLDTYTAFIHADQNKKHPEVKEVLEKHGFKIGYGHGTWQDGKLRANVLNGFARALPQNEYIMTADSDEFQMWPNNNIREHLLNGSVDAIQGVLIDRFDTTLHNATSEELDSQFPLRHRNLEGKFMSNETPISIRTHICIHKISMPVCFTGSHEFNSSLKDVIGKHIVRGEIEILHFKWRDTIRERFKTKSYHAKDADNLLKEFFRGGNE